jgi:hypothetical protein
MDTPSLITITAMDEALEVKVVAIITGMPG